MVQAQEQNWLDQTKVQDVTQQNVNGLYKSHHLKSKQPMAIIQFKQNQVTEFAQPLAKLLQREVVENHEQSYEIITLTPQSGREDEITQMQAWGKENAKKVIEYMVELGVSRQQITHSHMFGEQVSGNEVQIYSQFE